MSNTPLNENVIPCQLSRNGSDFIAYSRTPSQAKKTPEVLFLSGLRSDMLGTKAQALSDHCAHNDQGFTRFDYYGHGSSSGSFTEGTIGLWLEDTLEIIDKITEGPLILVGSSLGGWLAFLAAMARPTRVAGIVGIAAAPDFTEELMWAGFSPQQREELTSKGLTFLPNSYEDGDDTLITHHFIEEGRSHLILGKSIPIQCPIHLLHGTHDTDVPWEFSMKLLEKVESEDTLLTLVKEGDHRLSSPEQLQLLTNTLDVITEKTKNVD